MQSNKNFVLGCIVAALALLFVAAGDASAQLQNPSFESPDATGGDVPCSDSWNCFNFVYTTAAVAHSGVQAMKTFGPFAPGGGSGAVQYLPAAPGQTWVGEIYAMNASFDPIDNVDFGVYKIEFLDVNFQLAAGGIFGVDVFESNQINASAPLDTWTLLGVGTAPAPAGTAYAQAVVVKVDVDGTQGGSIFWDDASLVIDDISPAAESTWGQIRNLFR